MPKLSSTESKKLAVKSARNGRGVFALKDFKKGQIIFEITGTLVTCNEDEEMDEEERSNTYRFTKKWFISPKGRLGDMLNHSCLPNAYVSKREGKLYIVAATPVTKGTEVVIDYSTILASDDSWSMQCNCGTLACRKVIKQFNKIPKKLQLSYRALRMVPNYILST
jgi:SET domain-containing protein